MTGVAKTFYGRAYGFDIRVEKNDDGTLSAYQAPAFSERYQLVMRDDTATVLRKFDVSGAIKEWLERS